MKLKSCPLCGSTDIIKKHNVNNEYNLTCLNCEKNGTLGKNLAFRSDAFEPNEETSLKKFEPNEETIDAMEAARRGELEKHSSIKDLMADLNDDRD